MAYPDPVDCGRSRLVCYTTNFTVPFAEHLRDGDNNGLNPVNGFGQFYEIAVRQAEDYFSTFAACPQGDTCHLVPFKVTYATWSATDTTVTVDIYYEVTCNWN